MAPSIDLAEHDMLALGRAALATLRAALLRDTGPAAASYLQEAGYAGGSAVFEGFRDWLRERGSGEPEDLEVTTFQHLASEYFRDAGWGTIRVGDLHDAVATVDTEDWGEADPAEQLDHPACHFTTGMFADFFGRMSDVPLAVLEVECRSSGSSRCRFLLGNGEVMRYVYERMERGEGYEEAVRGVV
ncbi:MAG TPA: 4-vinyl reductase [Gemmatimonadaceae bacterium]